MENPQPAVRIGIGCIPGDYNLFPEWVRTAEATGFSHVATGDSPTLWNDPFITLAIAAQHSSTLRLSVQGTNPISRHPVASAAAMESLQLLSGGRAFYGLGSGDSAVANMGKPRAKMAEVEAYGRAVQSLCSGRPAVYQGQTLTMKWAAKPVPMHLCSEGPKTQRLAGTFADGAILFNGISREVVEASIRQVHAGVTEAGRSVDDVELQWIIPFELCDDVAAGREAIKFALAGTANRAFRHSLTDKFVPEHLHAGFRGLQAEYRSSSHQQLGDHHFNASLLDKYGLTDYLIERFAIIGPPAVCAERLRELISWGARTITLTTVSLDRAGQIDLMRRTADTIFPDVF